MRTYSRDDEMQYAAARSVPGNITYDLWYEIWPTRVTFDQGTRLNNILRRVYRILGIYERAENGRAIQYSREYSKNERQRNARPGARRCAISGGMKFLRLKYSKPQSAIYEKLAFPAKSHIIMCIKGIPFASRVKRISPSLPPSAHFDILTFYSLNSVLFFRVFPFFLYWYLSYGDIVGKLNVVIFHSFYGSKYTSKLPVLDLTFTTGLKKWHRD